MTSIRPSTINEKIGSTHFNDNTELMVGYLEGKDTHAFRIFAAWTTAKRRERFKGHWDPRPAACLVQRRDNAGTMPDYKQMLKEAEEREANVKKVFQQYDLDGGGSIDPGEITCVMEDLGLLNGLKTDVTAFVAAAFARYDENDDGALSFEVQPPDSPASSAPARAVLLSR